MREFGNRLAAYAYRVIRYLTYNSDAAPFPFAEPPASLEPADRAEDRLPATDLPVGQ